MEEKKINKHHFHPGIEIIGGNNWSLSIQWGFNNNSLSTNKEVYEMSWYLFLATQR